MQEQLGSILFEYEMPELECTPILFSFLSRLDRKLNGLETNLVVTDMKFKRGKLDISYYLTGEQSDSLEIEIDDAIGFLSMRVSNEIQRREISDST